MSRPAPTRYRTLNGSAHNASLRERGSLTVWFDPDTVWKAQPSGRRGRQQVFSDAAIQACLTIKVLFGLPLRQATGFVVSLLKLAGLDWPVPDHGTLCRRQRTLAVQLPCRGTKDPLHLLADSTGIKFRGEGEWHARKHGGARRRAWRTVHLAVDEVTLEVRAVEITGSHVGDAPMLPDLLGQVPGDEPIGSSPGTVPTTRAAATMPSPSAAPTPSSHHAATQSRAGRTAPARNDALRAVKRLVRTIWRRWSGCHRRRRVEAKMNCIKLLGQKLMARDFERQTAELQVRIAILSRYTTLGIPVAQPVA